MVRTCGGGPDQPDENHSQFNKAVFCFFVFFKCIFSLSLQNVDNRRHLASVVANYNGYQIIPLLIQGLKIYAA